MTVRALVVPLDCSELPERAAAAIGDPAPDCHVLCRRPAARAMLLP